MRRVAHLFFILCALSLANTLAAEDGVYAVSRIPASLLKNAHAVKRMESIVFEVVNTGEAVMRKKYAITILDESGEDFAEFEEYYDDLHSIRNIEGSLYDAAGKELKRLKNKQVFDLTGTDGSSLADDHRRKFHKFYYKVYPYTIEYEVDIRYYGTLFFPAWVPVEGEHFSVQNSRMTISTPKDYQVRYRVFNFNGKPVLDSVKDTRSMTWEANALPAVEDEYASPGWYEKNTVVLFGPTEFEIERYKGTMTSWQDFGKFVYSLKKGRDELPDNIKQVVHQLTDKLSSDREKVNALYDYLQKNTRYISIQLGIGGWQPFEAKYVAAKSYGDCKALTNYMYSLLREAGIYSIYTLVKSGRRTAPVIADFPSQQFNHVILCVPNKKDTIWLECTSQTSPPGYLGMFTGDRNVLLVTEDGGVLVRTPKYAASDNSEIRRIKASLDEEATLTVNCESVYGGIQQEPYHDMIHSLSREKLKEFLHEQLDLATYDIKSFDYKEKLTAMPEVVEKLEIEARNYATISGKRLFIIPNIMTRSSRKLLPDSTRKYELDMRLAYHDIDTVEITLPPGYTAESMPKDITVSNQFGTYKASVRLIGSTLFYTRSMEHNNGRFPAKDYDQLVSFYDAIYKADRARVVLVKNETAPATKGF